MTSPSRSWLRTLKMLRRAAWPIARALLFGWLYWLQRGPGNLRYWQALGTMFVAVGVGFSIAQLAIFPGRLTAIEHQVTTVTVGGFLKARHSGAERVTEPKQRAKFASPG